LTKVLAGEGEPTRGNVQRSGSIGYLPQDTRSGDLDQRARERVLSARDLDGIRRRLKRAEIEMGSEHEGKRSRAVDRCARLAAACTALGGWAADAEAAQITAHPGLHTTILDHPLPTLSGGQRRRVELARILFSRADTLLLAEPTNHLDADSIAWLRDFLRSYSGGVVVISHDVALLEATVNTVLHLDASRSAIDV